ncbi:hypothetical protein G6F65_014354 [Rhizopus arrhizus]|nr:hypothetical protein G6F65_014354 [Rhizopus arrhizus]
MQRHRRPHARHHAHRARAFQLVYIDHLLAGRHRQVHGFAGGVAQGLQVGRQRGAQVELRPGTAGQGHQARSQSVDAAGFGHHALLGQRGHDAIDGGARVAATARKRGGRRRLGRVGHRLQHGLELGKRRSARDLGFRQERPQIVAPSLNYEHTEFARQTARMSDESAILFICNYSISPRSKPAKGYRSGRRLPQATIPSMSSQIRIVGARQNNLKNLALTIATGELVVVTGVSGSGKSSLAFDTLYAEGQRRYVETFSPYARQFLDRMDKPQVDRIEGILPAIAIDQTNPVRSSRSTVGTMTELNDHLKLLFARGARLYCRGCGKVVRRDTPDSIYHSLAERAAVAGDPRLVVTFPIAVPANFTEDEVRGFLEQQGYTRVHAEETAVPRATAAAKGGKAAKGAKKGKAAKDAGEERRILHVIQDRFRFAGTERERVMEALDTALRMGAGHLAVYVMDAEGGAAEIWKYSDRLHCADCHIEYTDPLPSSFSFNSPLGACESCRGCGRVIGIDFGLVIPDENKTLLEGAIKPWTTPSYKECQDELQKR